MINIVYGYCVLHGGIGRYISETLKHSSSPGDYNIVALESNIELPGGANLILLECERNPVFMSADENKAFSGAVRRFAENSGGIIHSHGIYDFVPDIYTAHMCAPAYFKAIRNSVGDDELRSTAGCFEYMAETERRMITALPEERIVAVSGKVAKELAREYGMRMNKMSIIPGASRFPIAQKTQLGRNDYVIGFVGGNLHAKGIALLAEVMERLSDRGYYMRCVGAGCVKEISDFMSGRCDFTSVGKVEIGPSFYQNVDCFVSLSPYEAWSLSTIEAMSQGVPVVSTRGNGIFDCSDGFFAVSDGSVEQTAGIIEKLMRDWEFRDSVVSSGFELVKNLSWDENARKYEELYEELL